MAFGILQRRGMARRGMIAALMSSRPPPFQLITRSYSNKLFVGGLSFRSDEEAVRRAFGQHGEVVEVKLISDRETGRPKGFGFVTFQTEAEAETARTKMTGQLLDGRVIRVDKAAASRPPLPSSSNYGGGFGGGMNTSSATSSNLPPVSEDWGTIPTNVFHVGQTAAPPSPAASPASNTADSAKPFDSSSFGQAAAWSSSTPATSPSGGQASTPWPSNAPAPSQSNGQASTAWPGSTPSPSGGQASTAWHSSTLASSASSLSSSTFGSASTVNSSFGSSATTPSSSNPGVAWPSNTPADPISSSGVSGQTSSVNSSAASGGFTSFGAAMADVKPFDSSTFGSASGKATSSTASFGGSMPTASTTASTTVASPAITATTVASTTSSLANTTTTASNLGSTTTTATSSTGVFASSATATSADTNKPEVLSTSPTTIPTPSTPSAHPLNSPALTSTGQFDLSKISFNSSSYRESEPPLPRRRPRPRPRPNMNTTTSDFNSSTASILEMRSPFGSNNQFAETSIPKPRGPEFDFGLLNITAPCPEGFRPQGVFDIYIPDDLPEIPPPEPKPKPEKPTSLMMFPHRQLPALDLPYDTPEADSWSEIGSDPPKYDLSSLFPSMGEIIKKDKELHWDPYDFDEDAKAVLPIEEERIIFESDYDEPFR